MWVTTARMVFWRDKCLDLEKRFEKEMRRNRNREDALLNRILTRTGAYPILDDEVDPSLVEPSDMPAESPLMDEMRVEFDQWAADSGASDYEKHRQWEIHKDGYARSL